MEVCKGFGIHHPNMAIVPVTEKAVHAIVDCLFERGASAFTQARPHLVAGQTVRFDVSTDAFLKGLPNGQMRGYMRFHVLCIECARGGLSLEP